MTSESQLDMGRSARLVEPLVQHNAFRGRPDGRAPLPDFSAIRDLLPDPVLPGRADWVKQYWQNWAILWAGVRNPPSASALNGPVRASPPGGSILMGDTALIGRLAGYAYRGFDLIHLLDNFYAAQHDNGFIPREIEINTGDACVLPFEPNSTGPNMLAWTEWRHYRLVGDEVRLREVFAPLIAYHRWLNLNRTWQSGLYWSTGAASGNVAQSCVPQGDYHHQHWAWLDATLQANVSALLLGRMAELLEESAIAEELSAERSALGRRVNSSMWNEETGFYHHTDAEGKFSDTRSMSAFWALLDRQLVSEDRRQLLTQALRDEHNGRRHVADGNDAVDAESKSREDASQMTPIAATPLTTYVAMRGLQTAGSWPLAHQMAVDYLEEASIAPQSESQEAAAIFVLTMLEQVIGLSIDWPLRQVTWRNYLGNDAETGVRRVTLGDEGTADLLAANGVLTVRTAMPFTLSYRDREQEFQSAVPAGVSTFDLR